MSQAAISDYERGRRRPGLAGLTELARLLEVPVGWLLTGTGEGSPATQPDEAPSGGASLLDRRLADILGIVAMPDWGEAGFLDQGKIRRQADVSPGAMTAAGDAPVAAESPAPYGAAATRRTPLLGEGALPPATYALDAALAAGAEALVRYVGPDAGPLRNGDLLLVARRPGRPGLRLLHRAGPATEDGAPVWAVEGFAAAGIEAADGQSLPVITAGERIVGILRWF